MITAAHVRASAGPSLDDALAAEPSLAGTVTEFVDGAGRLLLGLLERGSGDYPINLWTARLLAPPAATGGPLVLADAQPTLAGLDAARPATVTRLAAFANEILGVDLDAREVTGQDPREPSTMLELFRWLARHGPEPLAQKAARVPPLHQARRRVPMAYWFS